MTHEYDDIIHLPHPVSKHFPPMPMSERAAQFSSFAAVANPSTITQMQDDNMETIGLAEDFTEGHE